MTPASTVLRVARSDFRWDNPAGPAADVRRIADAAAAADGSAPLDEAALLTLRHRGLEGSALWLAGPADGPAMGLAWLHDGALDLVVTPAARGTGLGAALAAAAVPATGRLDRLVARQPPRGRRARPAVRAAPGCATCG